MGLSYVWIGCKHFINPSFFFKIVPPYLPFPLELVFISGGVEILFGAILTIPFLYSFILLYLGLKESLSLSLLFKKTRFYASWGIILLLIAVSPANIYLAFSEDAQQAIGVSSFMASWVRLPIQFVLIGLAYKASKI